MRRRSISRTRRTWRRPRRWIFCWQEVRRAGVEVRFGVDAAPDAADTIVDCRGLAARDVAPRSARRARRASHRALARDLARPARAAAAPAPPALHRALGRRALHDRRHRPGDGGRRPGDGAFRARASGCGLRAASGVRGGGDPRLRRRRAACFSRQRAARARARGRPAHLRQRRLPARLPAGAGARQRGRRSTWRRVPRRSCSSPPEPIRSRRLPSGPSWPGSAAGHARRAIRARCGKPRCRRRRWRSCLRCRWCRGR